MGQSDRTEIASEVPAVRAPSPPDAVHSALEQFLEAAPAVTQSLGEFMVAVGEFERRVGRSMDSLAKEFMSEGGVLQFVRVAPPEVVARFLQVMVRAAKIGAPDLAKMTADQKVNTGEEMKVLASEMKELSDLITKEVRKAQVSR
jgi:hypothetical protein